jgi:RNA polymerase sigma-70 factor (ECF subfamily)
MTEQAVQPNEAYMEDSNIAEALRQGDEVAFVTLLNRYHTALIQLAKLYVANPSDAEEIVQETWIGVMQGIHRFEGRASLKTWIFRILINQAKKRAIRAQRQIPFSALWQADEQPGEAAVEADWFHPANHPESGHWVSFPQRWDGIPESYCLSQETQSYLRAAITDLPASQREVIILRDVNGFSTDEVCELLGISEGNQRVLLHRARAKVRRALETYYKL